MPIFGKNILSLKQAMLDNARINRVDLLVLAIFFILGLIFRFEIFNVFIKYPYFGVYQYILLAKNISCGLGSFLMFGNLDIGVIKQPLYPLLISFTHVFIKDWINAAVFMDLFIMSLIIFPLFAITKSISNKAVGYVACVIYSCSPFFIIPGGPHGVFIFFLCLPILLILQKERNILISLIFGFLLSLLWLVRYESVFFILFFISVYIISFKSIKDKIAPFVTVLLIFCLTTYLFNVFLSPRASLTERIRYRATMNYFILKLHSLPVWKYGDLGGDEGIYNENPKKVLELIIEKSKDKMLPVYIKNIPNSLRVMFDYSLNIWIIVLALLGLIIIKRKIFFIVLFLLPLIYAPYCSLIENERYTRYSVFIIIIAASAGLFYLYIILQKLFNGKHKLLSGSIFIMLTSLLCLFLFMQKLPIALNYTYTESNYEYKKVCSEERFKVWIQSNVPADKKILTSNDISVHVSLINNYHLYFLNKNTLDIIIKYAKYEKIEYCLLSEDILDTEDYAHVFDKESLSNKDYYLIDKYISDGHIFYLIRIY